jgi:hypothetical protein
MEIHRIPKEQIQLKTIELQGILTLYNLIFSDF